HHPRASSRLVAAVAPVTLIVNGHENVAGAAPLWLSNRVREDVLERRNAGAEMAYLHALGRRQPEQLPRSPVTRHEDTHDVIVGRVAIHAGRAQPIEE